MYITNLSLSRIQMKLLASFPMFSIILNPPSLTASVYSVHAYHLPTTNIPTSHAHHLSSNPSSFSTTRRFSPQARIFSWRVSDFGECRWDILLRMACASQALVAANACAFSARTFLKKSHRIWNGVSSFLVRASVDDTDCNVEECAPDKEVGKVSVEWLAGEKTRVVGTYPPRKKGWTGYVEKDTAGQTNIYSVEPAVYVAESALSSGSAGTSADGSEKTVTIAASIAFISIAAACVIVLQVGKTTPSQPQTLEYSGPTLTYYINKFKPTQEVVIQASMPGQPESVLTDQSSSPLLE